MIRQFGTNRAMPTVNRHPHFSKFGPNLVRKIQFPGKNYHGPIEANRPKHHTRHRISPTVFPPYRVADHGNRLIYIVSDKLMFLLAIKDELTTLSHLAVLHTAACS